MIRDIDRRVLYTQIQRIAEHIELDQKSFSVIARSCYDDGNRFEAAVFDGLPYTEYQSLVLRAGGQDGVRARMRDTLGAYLARQAGLLNQESEVCVMYLNGQYYGQYEIRERINTMSGAEEVCAALREYALAAEESR